MNNKPRNFWIRPDENDRYWWAIISAVMAILCVIIAILSLLTSHYWLAGWNAFFFLWNVLSSAANRCIYLKWKRGQGL